ncbi:Oidioi.mRNA.OKI2018_I69.chr2.g4502.t1.cds [Oikopleura dioica]|uniref:Oidioi.mRNA.OKI2018_I69.chr2.g4502.t1.cds n=1 Tax=Oikopleura dioica TaxID=34765 RepID=A0ABN7T6M4_OIKDI|nr:Oidioi.mRNA.OKI2018_I69.chr2.g4502.t1.cds [Oikopleura dioica]
MLLNIVTFLATLNSAAELQYTINDGTTRGSYIGNLPQDAQLGSPLNVAQRVFKIIEGEEYLDIDASSGDLYTKKEIDRESICGIKEDCSLEIEVLSTPQEFFNVFNIKLLILDLNDNSPKFPESQFFLTLPESAEIGTILRLSPASDADTFPYQVKKYFLESEQKPKYFEIKEEKGSSIRIPQIQLTRELDVNKRSRHVLKIIAEDGGGRRGEAEVIIEIEDINDHSPKFESTEIEVSISENAEVGTIITTLHATDADKGINGEIVYSFQENINSQSTMDKFSLNSSTGELKIAKPLDFESAAVYNLHIKADDKGVGSSPAYTTVVVNLIDENDNSPEIRISWLSNAPGSMPEDAKIGDFVALINVQDKDNDDVHLEVQNSSDFELESNSKNRYLLKTKSFLDRERIDEYNLKLIARDSGFPARETVKNVKILITDINDNAPFFRHGQYNLQIDENNSPGVTVAQILAEDLDEGPNAEISYSINDPLGIFDIDSESGNIIVLESINAERFNESDSDFLSFEIIASDHGRPSLSGSTQVKIFINDVNEFAPMFSSRNSNFSIAKNAKIATSIGYVEAIDADKSSKMIFTISPARADLPFSINDRTGEISLSKSLWNLSDVPVYYQFQVVVSDSEGLIKDGDVAEVVVYVSESFRSLENIDDASKAAVVLVGIFAGAVMILITITIFICVRFYKTRNEKRGPTIPPSNSKDELFISLPTCKHHPDSQPYPELHTNRSDNSYNSKESYSRDSGVPDSIIIENENQNSNSRAVHIAQTLSLERKNNSFPKCCDAGKKNQSADKPRHFSLVLDHYEEAKTDVEKFTEEIKIATANLQRATEVRDSMKDSLTSALAEISDDLGITGIQH